MSFIIILVGATSSLAEFIHAGIDKIQEGVQFDFSHYFEGGFNEGKKVLPLFMALAINNTEIIELLTAKAPCATDN
jgi:hypothetical protein